MIALSVVMVAPMGCSPKTAKRDGEGKRDVVEVLYFHGPQRCSTCTEVEELTMQLLGEQFSEPMQAGRLRFRTIDIVEQEDIADEYEVVWSSLLLADYDSEGHRVIEDLTDSAFLRVNTAPEELRAEIIERIHNLLNN